MPAFLANIRFLSFLSFLLRIQRIKTRGSEKTPNPADGDFLGATTSLANFLTRTNRNSSALKLDSHSQDKEPVLLGEHKKLLNKLAFLIQSKANYRVHNVPGLWQVR